jgi:hypothetical protein
MVRTVRTKRNLEKAQHLEQIAFLKHQLIIAKVTLESIAMGDGEASPAIKAMAQATVDQLTAVSTNELKDSTPSNIDREDTRR